MTPGSTPVGGVAPVAVERAAARVGRRYGLNERRIQEARLGARVWGPTSSGDEEAMEARVLEAVLIGETYLGRHRDVTGALLRDHLPALVRERGGRPLRVLFAGCSTGEEVWSFLAAWSRSDLGRRPDSIRVLAVDALPRSVAVARRARYGSWSLRGVDVDKERGWLEVDGTSVRVRERLKAAARFEVHNLLEPLTALASEGQFDLVFCRNVLIYLRPEARRTVWTHLEQVVAEDGLVLSAGADPGPPVGTGLRRAVEGPCVLHRRVPEGTEREGAAASPDRPVDREERRAVQEPEVAAAPAPPRNPVEVARALIGGGRVQSARSVLQAALSKDPLDVSALVLTALLEAETGDDRAAAAAARRATFLAPDEPFPAWILVTALARAGAPESEVRRRGVVEMLRGLPSDAPLAYSDGLVAGQLKEILGGR